MANKKFMYLILGSFLSGTLLLIVLHFNFIQNIRSMRSGNMKLMKELRLDNHLRVIDHNIVGIESRIRAAVATGDTTHLSGINSKVKVIDLYIDSLKAVNTDPQSLSSLDRLQALATEKANSAAQLILRYQRTGNMKDLTVLANPSARKTADEVTALTEYVYNNQQKLTIGLSNRLLEGTRKARIYGNILMMFMLFSAAVLCWFMLKQFNRQNMLILKLDGSEKIARKALLVKENFLANMSHEIRTPLNAILGFTNLLRRCKLEGNMEEYVTSIQSAGENLLYIINDILDLSKIEAGMMRIIKEPFSVNTLLSSVESLFHERLAEKGLLLVTEIDQNLPGILIGDATRLTQILVNLIGNAIKFSDSGAIHVRFYVKSQDERLIQVGVSVADQGIGISKDKLLAIFERFNQAEDFITRNYGGTGLGLSIVKTLILLQGGEITVDSQQGKGTTFELYIPYTVAESHQERSSGNIEKRQISQSLSILIVDDNTMNQNLLKHLFLEWGCTFDIASNGLEAISHLELKKYDLVLMDIQMPKMNGYTATRYIRNNLGLSTPIIAMTAHALAAERQNCISNGMNEYISKPILEDVLFELISGFSPASYFPQSESAPYSRYQYIDISYMKLISKGDIPFEKNVTAEFIRIVPADIDSLKLAGDRKQVSRINDIAHNLKTSVAILGLLPLLESTLDKLEMPMLENHEISSLLEQLESVTVPAVKEAVDFYATL